LLKQLCARADDADKRNEYDLRRAFWLRLINSRRSRFESIETPRSGAVASAGFRPQDRAAFGQDGN
jgi:hypothetical protein